MPSVGFADNRPTDLGNRRDYRNLSKPMITTLSKQLQTLADAGISIRESIILMSIRDGAAPADIAQAFGIHATLVISRVQRLILKGYVTSSHPDNNDLRFVVYGLTSDGERLVKLINSYTTK